MKYFGVLGLLAAAQGCAKAPVQPPKPFAESAAFRSLSHDTYGILEGDIDGDGAADAVVVRQHEDGYRLEVLRTEWHGAATGWVWRKVCRGGYVVGDDLDALRWVHHKVRSEAAAQGHGDHDGPWVFLRALRNDPDGTEQTYVIFDVQQCRKVDGGRVLLPRPDGGLLAPKGLLVGVQVLPQGLVIVDQPEYLRLQGHEHEWHVLWRVRKDAHRWEQLGGEHHQHGQVQSLLRPVLLDLLWQPHSESFENQPESEPASAASPQRLPMLVDDNGATAFALRQAEGGRLIIEAASAVVLLELHHGCGAHTPSRLRFLTADGSEFDDSHTAVKQSSGVLASGVPKLQEDGSRKDLVLPTGQPERFELVLEGPLCLRGMKAYGFVE